MTAATVIPLAARDPAPSTGATGKGTLALADTLVGMLEYRDPYFRSSSSLTRLLATAIARELGVAEPDVEAVALAAVLRDLGRLAVGQLVAPQVQLDSDSRRRVERHVELTLALLDGIELPPGVREAIRHHHERWDGSGYPDGLAGEAIPLGARILGVADSFAAMVAPRSHRPPRRIPAVIEEIRTGSGRLYDRAIVEALLRVAAPRSLSRLGFGLRHHIIVAHPDQIRATHLALSLCRRGYLAEVVRDVDEARERLLHIPADALVLAADLGLEVLAGFIPGLRATPAGQDLPLLVVEADAPADRTRLIEAGADICLRADAPASEIRAVLSSLIARVVRTRTAAARAGATLGQTPWYALQGDLKTFPLAWLLQVLQYDTRTAAVLVRGEWHAGAIYIERGTPYHAQVDEQEGEEALRSLLRWESGDFTVHLNERIDRRTVTTSLMQILLEQAVDEDHDIFGAVKSA